MSSKVFGNDVKITKNNIILKNFNSTGFGAILGVISGYIAYEKLIIVLWSPLFQRKTRNRTD